MNAPTPRSSPAEPRPGKPLTFTDADSESSGLPGWLKIAGLVLIIIGLVVLAMLLLGGGHNPMQHF